MGLRAQFLMGFPLPLPAVDTHPVCRAWIPRLAKSPPLSKRLKAAKNKYDYDNSCAAFRLAGVLPQGSWFPFDFRFIPSTLAEDGDPLDVLVFMDTSAPVGCVLTVRLIGVIEAKQRSKGEPWIRNDRLLAVATHAHTHAHIETLDGLRPHLLDEIEAFFETYTALKGKNFLNSQNWDAPGRYQSTPKPPYPARLAICRRR